MARRQSVRQRSASPANGGYRLPAPRLFTTLSAALSALLACPAWAAKWDIVPMFSAEETYTDNVKLSAPGSERSDWVTQLRPGVAVNARGDGLRLNARYAPEFLYRSQEGSRGVSHQFNANANAELFKQLLFVDASASVAQQNISLLGPQADSNVNNTGNRTTVRSFNVSPSLRHNFGHDARGEARFSYTAVGSGVANSNSQANGVNLRLASGPSFKLYTWNLAYDRQTTRFAQSPDVTSQNLSAYGRRMLTPQVAMVSTVGYETSDLQTTGEAPKGIRWNAGLEWTPTPRTRLTATTGKRYFGQDHAFDFSHRTGLTVWSAGYSEDVTTARAQALAPATVSTAGNLDQLFLSKMPDQEVRKIAVDAYIAQNGLPASMSAPLNFISDSTFLSKSWRGSVGIQGIRNTIFANAFIQTRESLAVAQPGAGDFAQSPNTRQTGGSLVWTTRISPQTAPNLSVGYTRNELLGTGRADRQKFFRAGVSRQFGPRFSGTLNFRRLQSVSTQDAASYTENALTAALLTQF